MKKLLLLLFMASPVLADTAVTLYDTTNNHYFQMKSPPVLGQTYYVIVPLNPGTTNQVLSINSVAGNVLQASWTTNAAGSAVWGTISGTLSNQTDLQAILNGIGVATGTIAPNLLASTNTWTGGENFTRTVTISSGLIANGSAGNLGQVLVSNGPNSVPSFVDPVVSQATDSNLNASVSIKGSSNTVTVALSSSGVNASTVAASQQGVWTVSVAPGIQLASGTINVAGVGSFTTTPGTGTATVNSIVTMGSGTLNVTNSTVSINNAQLGGVYGVLVATNNVVVSSNTYYYSNVTFQIIPGTATGVYAFEDSADTGTTWQPVLCERLSNGVVLSSYSQTVSFDTSTWQCNIAGSTNFRVRAAQTYQPQIGSTITIVTDGIPYNPFVMSNLAVAISSNGNVGYWPVGYTNTGSSVPVNVLNTVTTNIPLGIQLASSTLNVNVPLGIQLASTTLTVILSSNGVNASTVNVVQPATVSNFRIDLSTLATTANPANVFMLNYGTNPINIVGVSGSTVAVGYQLNGSSLPVNVLDVTSVTVQGIPTVQGTLADNGAAAATNRVGVVPSIYQTSYLNGTAANQGRNGALTQGTDGLLWTANLPALRPADYHASSATQVAASATDIATICGQTSDTTLLTAIRVSCTQTTAGIVHLSILKRSSANSTVTAGISTMTVVPGDSNYAAASTTATYVYTSNPTRGTLLGQLDSYNIGCMAPGTATPNDIYLSPAWWRTKPIVLRNTNQCVSISLANGVDGLGTTVTGGVFNINFDWIETSSITP